MIIPSICLALGMSWDSVGTPILSHDTDQVEVSRPFSPSKKCIARYGFKTKLEKRRESIPLSKELSKALRGIASYYGKQHHGRLMANGKPFNMNAISFAHKTYPLGTEIEVCYKSCVTGRVTDRGPYIPGRVLDLSQAAAIQIGLAKFGVGEVKYRIISTPVRMFNKLKNKRK